MIYIGDTIHLELEESHQGQDRIVKKYRCKLIDHKENFFAVDPPVNEETGRTGFFMDGVELRAWFIGKDQAVYAFDTEVKGKDQQKVRSLLLTDPGIEQYIRIQRRNYVRIDASLDTAIYPDVEGKQPFVTSTVDISGGGMAVLLPDGHGLSEKDTIRAWVVLQTLDGTIHYLKMSCAVIRIIDGDGRKKDRCSLRFEIINDTDRQLVIKYCFEQQLQMRKYSKSRNR